MLLRVRAVTKYFTNPRYIVEALAFLLSVENLICPFFFIFNKKFQIRKIKIAVISQIVSYTNAMREKNKKSRVLQKKKKKHPSHSFRKLCAEYCSFSPRIS